MKKLNAIMYFWFANPIFNSIFMVIFIPNGKVFLNLGYLGISILQYCCFNHEHEFGKVLPLLLMRSRKRGYFLSTLKFNQC